MSTHNKKQLSEKGGAIGFIFCIIVFFVIGLTTLLFGCNTYVSKTCRSYYIKTGVVVGSTITQHTCTKCTTYNSKNTCISYSNYNCYDASVKVTYGNNQTCSILIDTDEESKTKAESSTNSYQKNKQLKILVSKADPTTCYTKSYGIVLWSVGVTFLSIFGFCCLLLCAIACDHASKPLHKMLTPPPPQPQQQQPSDIVYV
jgi:hypothetical protein